MKNLVHLGERRRRLNVDVAANDDDVAPGSSVGATDGGSAAGGSGGGTGASLLVVLRLSQWCWGSLSVAGDLSLCCCGSHW